MNQNELNNSIAVASMRPASIQPALNNTYPDMNKKADLMPSFQKSVPTRDIPDAWMQM